VERYGLSETGIVASNDIDWPAPGTVGRPLDGMRVAIATPAGYAEFGSGDAGGGAVPASGDGDAGATSRGPSGEICVAGPSVTEGYDRDPEATAAAIRDGFFHTGDLGRFDPSGRLVIEGRLKELIIVGGANVAPAEVENALAGVEGVKELAAAGQSHYDLGEVVCAYVVARSAAAAEGLKERLAETAAVRLAPYKRPRAYFLVEELPRNAMGKIDRSRLQR
jgi:acyl-CoA synthetase (AMP-forming)/AMP-acid ligase II